MAEKVYSCLNQGIKGKLIEVEVDILRGMSSFSIVGLGDTAVQEAKERVRSAIKNCGVEYPRQKKVINLAPAHIKKQGPHFDLPMAIGLLIVSSQIETEKFNNSIIVGELALDGKIRPIRGVLTMTIFAKKNGYKKIYIPAENYSEAKLVKGIEIIPVHHLRELIEPAKISKTIQENLITNPERRKLPTKAMDQQVTLDDIHGNESAKRALEIAAAGGHHILFTGPPGVGKTLLAKALPSILPPLSNDEMLQVMQIHSNAGSLDPKQIIRERPFRQVHSSCSLVSLTGGGSIVKPGEVSLAHRGILFLDELPEFPRGHLESLRQPLEDKKICVSRIAGTVIYPSQFTLVASMNPCPCGYQGDREKECTCRPYQIIQYQKKLSGPLMDRIDMVVEIKRQSTKNFQEKTKKIHQIIKQKIIKARQIQKERFKNLGIKTNSEMSSKLVHIFCKLDTQQSNYLQKAIEQLSLSGRQYYQLLKASRTIADLKQNKNIQKEDLTEALQYRHR